MAQATVLGIRRYFTKEGTDPYEMFSWVERDSKIDNPVTGKIAFEQKSVEFPDTWSQIAEKLLFLLTQSSQIFNLLSV